MLGGQLSWGSIGGKGRGRVAPPRGQGAAAPASLLAPSFAHGGSLAAMMDETFSKTAYLAGEGLFTLSLSIKFKK